MAKKSIEEEAPLTQEDWEAQTPCPECGGRPGYNPAAGVKLLTGHTYNCPKRPQ